MNALATGLLTVRYLLELLLTLFVCFGAGSFVTRHRIPGVGAAAHVCICCVLGMGLLGLVALALGLAGLLTPLFMAPWLVTAFALGVVALRRDWKTLMPEACAKMQHSRLHVFPLAVLVAFCANALVGALAPDAQQDSLWYHLGCAQAWTQWQRIIAWPAVYPSNFLLHGSAIYSILLMFGDDINCSLLYAAQGFITYVAAAAFAQSWFGRAAGIWTFFLCAFVHGHIVWFVPINVGSDLTAAMFSTVGLLLAVHLVFGFMEWNRKAGIAGFAVSGLLIGFAATVKLTALGYAFVPWAGLCAFAILRRPHQRWAVVTGMLLFSVPMIAWGIRNAVWGCGNPFFPILRDRIPLYGGYRILNTVPSAMNAIILPTPEGLRRAWSLLPQKFMFASSAGSAGFIIHAFLCMAIFSRIPLIRAGGIIALSQWLVYFFTEGRNETIKYFSVVFPAGLVWIGGAVAWFETGAPVSRYIRNTALLILILFLSGTYALKQIRWGRHESIDWRYHPVLTREDRLRYLETKPYGLENARLYDWINHNTPSSSVVMVADIGYPLHIRRPYFYSDEVRSYLSYLGEIGITSPAAVAEWMRKNNVQYVIAYPRSLEPHGAAAYSLSRVSEAPASPAHLYSLR